MTAEGLADAPVGGLPAVQSFLRFSFGMMEKGEKPPPLPEGLDHWTETVLPGFLAGALYGSGTKWLEMREKRPVGTLSPSSALPRAFRILDAANRRGLALGSLAALYWGVEMLSGVYHGQRAFMKDAAAGSLAVGAVYAAQRCVSSPTWPPPNVAANVAVILGIGMVQGFLQKLQHNERQQAAAAAAAAEDVQRRQEAAAARKQDAAWVLLAQLEASLHTKAEREQGAEEQQQQQQQQQQGDWRLQEAQAWHHATDSDELQTDLPLLQKQAQQAQRVEEGRGDSAYAEAGTAGEGGQRGAPGWRRWLGF